jgi:AcrR family transcriptional regulator
MARITQQNKEETRTSIIKEAYELFSDLGYSKTNTKTIAKKCNIAEGTIFNYFDTKDDILIAVFDDLSKHTNETELVLSHDPMDEIIDVLIIPLKKLDMIPKPFMMDIIISAMKLSRNNNLIHKLLVLDMSYVNVAKEKMDDLLVFKPDEINASVLSEILYATVATDYILYIIHASVSFDEFERTVRNKLRLLMKPYQKSALIQVKEDISR